MNSKTIAAAFAGLCLVWGAAQAAPETAQGPQASSPVEEPQAASPQDTPDGVGATNDVVILELAPMQGGGPGASDDAAAMQMLLLQLLMMQSQTNGAGDGETPMIAPGAAGGVGI